jgi:hypothetical protein
LVSVPQWRPNQQQSEEESILALGLFILLSSPFVLLCFLFSIFWPQLISFLFLAYIIIGHIFLFKILSLVHQKIKLLIPKMSDVAQLCTALLIFLALPFIFPIGCIVYLVMLFLYLNCFNPFFTEILLLTITLYKIYPYFAHYFGIAPVTGLHSDMLHDFHDSRSQEAVIPQASRTTQPVFDSTIETANSSDHPNSSNQEAAIPVESEPTQPASNSTIGITNGASLTSGTSSGVERARRERGHLEVYDEWLEYLLGKAANLDDLYSYTPRDHHDSRSQEATIPLEPRTTQPSSDSTTEIINLSTKDLPIKPFSLCYCCGYRLESRTPYCPSCGAFIRCPICWDQIKLGENINICPYCESRFHQEHLADWLVIKKKCPVCGHVLFAGIYC